MIAHYVFVDFENIMPEAKALSFLNNERVKTIIFVNAKQKLSVDRVKVLQPFGDRVDYIEMSGSGKNALDFMVAFYLGCVWSKNPKSKFYVVSKDKGFDPLLKHLTTIRSGSVQRVEDIMKIKKHVVTLASSSAPTVSSGTVRQKVVNICAALQNVEQPFPVSALRNFIKTTLNDFDLPEQHLDGLLSFMVQKELISIDDENGLKAYHLDKISAAAKGEFLTKESINIPPPALSTAELAQKACDDLKKRGNSKPRTLKTLVGTIKATFKGKLSDQQVDSVLNFMKNKKIIAVSNDTKITYDL